MKSVYSLTVTPYPKPSVPDRGCRWEADMTGTEGTSGGVARREDRARWSGRARLLGGGLVVAILSCGVALTARPASAASAKITICHRTHSTTNPYRKITVSQNAVQNSRHGGHDLPNGSQNPAAYDFTFLYAPNNQYWG